MVSPSAVLAVRVGVRTSQDESYGWNDGGNDGLRSFSYTGSNISWSYVFPSGSVSRKGALNFSVGAVFPTSSITINNVSIVGDSAATLIYAPGEYMRHGNLYNWTAATLGSGMLMENGNQKAFDSICPKGWKLPSIDNEASDSFANLLRAGKYYDIPSSTTGYNTLNYRPLNFVPTGLYNTDGYVSDQSSYSYWWSGCSVSQDTYAQYLHASPDRVLVNGNYYRGRGYAVRCLAR